MTPDHQSADKQASADRLAEAAEKLIAAVNYLHECEDAISADEGATDDQADEVISAFDEQQYAMIEAKQALAAYRALPKEPALPASKNEAAGDVPKWAMDAAKEIELDHQFGRMEPKRILDRAAIIAKHALDKSAADKERLDWLELYLSDYAKNLSAPMPGSPGWEFGYNAGPAYVIDGAGDTLREAIDSLQLGTPNAADKLADTRDQ